MKKMFMASGMAMGAALTFILMNKSSRKKAEQLIDDMLDEAKEMMNL